jgi:hypothetical protein
MTAREIRSQPFGCHKNGVLLVREFLIRPSLHVESLAQFQIQHGQPLQFAISEDGSIRDWTTGGRYQGVPPHIINLDPFPAAAVLKSSRSDKRFRLYMEPNWEGDPRHVLLRLHVDGVRYTISVRGDYIRAC